MPTINNIVLVHGGFVDGAGWRGVYDILKKDGFNVSIVQNPTISLAGDVGATKLVIDSQPGPVILVGHSYGGVVITEAGTDPNVAGLVYITAFAPDKGESVNTLIANPPPGAPVPPILPPKDGYLFLDKAQFAASFAGDVDAKTAALDALKMVGLEEWRSHKPMELSGGQQQRVTIARALVNKPAIVWGDEPTGNLDSDMSKEIVQLLRRLNQEYGLTLVLVTHDQGVAQETDRIVQMRNGLVEREVAPVRSQTTT